MTGVLSPPTWLAGPSQDEAATGRRAAKAQRNDGRIRVAAEQCNRNSDFEFGSVLTKMEDQIDRQGFVSELTLEEFFRLADERGIEVKA